jgi:ABC-2 type transport system ATP-binding protein
MRPAQKSSNQASARRHPTGAEPPQPTAAHVSLTGQYAAIEELQTGAENLPMMRRLARFDLVEARQRRSRPTPAACAAGATLPPISSRTVVLFLDEPTTGLDPRSRQVTCLGIHTQPWRKPIR